MILVTGGSGFLGRELCVRLSRLGEDVLEYSLDGEQGDSYLSIRGDICDKEQLLNLFKKYEITKIAHLASLLHTESCLHPSKAFQVNVLGSVLLLDFSVKSNVERFIFGSTVDAISGRDLEEKPVDETDELLPADIYGETKRFVEKLGLAYAQEYHIAFVSARLPVLVGPGTPTATSNWRMDIFNKLRTGGKIENNMSSEETLPLSHIKDSADQFIKLLTSDKPLHDAYNLPAESWQFSALADEIHRINPETSMECGTKLAPFCPGRVNWERFRGEFDYSPVPLIERMEEFHKSEE
jgi:nucleoside-diphosphate-sugar epimerase